MNIIAVIEGCNNRPVMCYRRVAVRNRTTIRAFVRTWLENTGDAVLPTTVLGTTAEEKDCLVEEIVNALLDGRTYWVDETYCFQFLADDDEI